MTSSFDILNQEFIGSDKTTYVTNCNAIRYIGAEIWGNGKWDPFGSDQFDVQKIGSQYSLKVRYTVNSS